MSYIIVIVIASVYFICSVLTAKILVLIGRTRLFWLLIYMLVGPLLVYYILLFSPSKKKLNKNEREKLMIYQVPIYLLTVVFLLLILVI